MIYIAELLGVCYEYLGKNYCYNMTTLYQLFI